MSEIFINKNKACAFSGHRKISKDFSLERLKSIIERLINEGYDTFLVGMAVGFDTICFKVLEEYRNKVNIKIIACIPCPEQAKNFSFNDKVEYERMLLSSDEKIVLSAHYTKFCMHVRNRYMVDNSSILVCYLNSTTGGTYSTYNYAVKNDLKVILVNSC